MQDAPLDIASPDIEEEPRAEQELVPNDDSPELAQSSDERVYIYSLLLIICFHSDKILSHRTSTARVFCILRVPAHTAQMASASS